MEYAQVRVIRHVFDFHLVVNRDLVGHDDDIVRVEAQSSSSKVLIFECWESQKTSQVEFGFHRLRKKKKKC